MRNPGRFYAACTAAVVAASIAAIQFDQWKDGQHEPRTAQEKSRDHEQHEQAREGLEEAARAAMSAGQYATN
jgi:hypothetical protein